jgi:serine/threonine-protein kinase
VFRSRNIGRYRLEHRIGTGGMGEVWAAFDEQLKRRVALKILRPDIGAQEGSIARFEREVMATAELEHPNTVRIFDHGVTHDGLWYYAMELLQGEHLASLIHREGPLPIPRAIHLIHQAARALAEAHAHGIVHRDIKSENLLVTTVGGEFDVVKVIDFGIARVSRSSEVAAMTTVGWLAGTPGYISPEAAQGEPVEAPADVYALGITLYHAVTGTLPFHADNAVGFLYKHIHEVPVSPSQRLGRPVPVDVENVLACCLAKAPAARFRHAGDLVRALEACADAGRWRAAPQHSPSTAAPDTGYDGKTHQYATRIMSAKRPA